MSRRGPRPSEELERRKPRKIISRSLPAPSTVKCRTALTVRATWRYAWRITRIPVPRPPGGAGRDLG